MTQEEYFDRAAEHLLGLPGCRTGRVRGAHVPFIRCYLGTSVRSPLGALCGEYDPACEGSSVGRDVTVHAGEWLPRTDALGGVTPSAEALVACVRSTGLPADILSWRVVVDLEEIYGRWPRSAWEAALCLSALRIWSGPAEDQFILFRAEYDAGPACLRCAGCGDVAPMRLDVGPIVPEGWQLCSVRCLGKFLLR